MPTQDAPIVVEPVPQVRRSLFGNYGAASNVKATSEPARAEQPVRRDPLDVAAARCFLAQYLARAFEYPAPETWAWLSDARTLEALRESATRVEGSVPGRVFGSAEVVAAACVPDAYAAFHDDYVTAISHAARGSCPINEIEYGELKADPLLQPHRLADLAAFYRAFGLELVEDGGERQDHLAVELEFLAVLIGQESNALSANLPDEVLRVNLDAQRTFLREHLGRWSPTFARRLEAMVAEGAVSALARLLLAVVVAECDRAGVASGGSDVSLRPADTEAALCDSCGLRQGLPGSAAPSDPE